MQDEFSFLGSLLKKKGQSKCPRCSRMYNNNAKPLYCSVSECGAYLGGKYEEKSSETDAKMISSTIASVRLNKAGIPV